MRIAVFGVGGVGGYFGWRLAKAGQDVVFVARGETLSNLKEYGLRVDTSEGQSVHSPVQVFDDPARVGHVDAILLGVKAWQVPEVAGLLRPMIGPETMVMPLQNGVEAPGQLSNVLGNEHVVGGLCRIIAFVKGPGHILHAGVEPYVAFGELDNRQSQRCERLQQAFREAGVQCEIPQDIQAAMWRKFLFIASFSGVAAVTRVPAGILRTVPETRELLVRIIEEILNVARGLNIALGEDAAAATVALVDQLPEGGTASMQRDIMEGRPSELSSQTGAVVRLGREAGVPTPINSVIYAGLLPQEQRARGSV